jgi:hypothetical protein
MTMTTIPMFKPDPIDGIAQRVVTDSGPIGANDQIVLCSHSAPITLTLPSGAPDTFFVIIKDFDGVASVNNVLIDCAPSESIDGFDDYTLDVDCMSITIGCDGSGRYFVV